MSPEVGGVSKNHSWLKTTPLNHASHPILQYCPFLDEGGLSQSYLEPTHSICFYPKEEGGTEAELRQGWEPRPPFHQAPLRTHSSAFSLSSCQMLSTSHYELSILYQVTVSENQPVLPGMWRDGPSAGKRESSKLEWLCFWWRGAKYFIFIK